MQWLDGSVESNEGVEAGDNSEPRATLQLLQGSPEDPVASTSIREGLR